MITTAVLHEDGWTVMYIERHEEDAHKPIELSVYFGHEGAGIELTMEQEEHLRSILNARHERRVK